MRLLLDTHVFLWAVTDSPKLGDDARRTIESAEAVHVSAASIWEAAIKARLGKLDVDPADLVRAIDRSGFVELPVRASHAAAVAALPAHHADPFDRLLVAQAVEEPLRLMTADAMLARYTELAVLV
ncbi:MAG: type II toxin-antitoxin system VapC family toxin [Burkholderiaceae bacterium]|jgi:PIN domain nuclease of toxin-antitoxin system|nr:type II toxin-antitoxin system VapC family toxin [Burkholderiales bacterium]MCZ8107115.1 type II toxin-antitoxin system VapC family toxin [Burkholderiales bacterium]MCZ8340303.1 type II toxin-antitoxin system VapC family toxin [Burkholderiaceae bacterium]